MGSRPGDVDAKPPDTTGAAGLAHLLASRRARAHEMTNDAVAATKPSPSSRRRAGGALALASAAAAAAKRSHSSLKPAPESVPTAATTKLAETPPPLLAHAAEASPSLFGESRPLRAPPRSACSTARSSGVSVPASLRWRCQHFLVSSLQRTTLAHGSAAIDPWADPQQCHARPLGCADADVLYCRQVEEGIYSEADGRLAPYEKAIRRIAYTLRSGGRTLMNQHRARNVAGLADDTLAASTTLGRRRLTTDRRLDACRAMMADADIFEDAPAAVVRCRKCGGGDVVSNLLQTRSADEPMTIFNRCANPKCNARWRQ